MQNQIKMLVSVISIIIICFNSFAAIIEYNDGSAFVSKVEFETLKKSFEKQIKDYENNVAAKVDDSIAMYLAEYKATNTQSVIDYITKIYDYDNKATTFYNNTGKTPLTTGNTTLLWAGLFDLDIYAGHNTGGTARNGRVTFWRYNNYKAPLGGLTEIANHNSGDPLVEQLLSSDYKWYAKRATYSNIGYMDIIENYRVVDKHHVGENRVYLTATKKPNLYAEPAVGMTWNIDVSEYKMKSCETKILTSDSTGNDKSSITRYHVFDLFEDSTNTCNLMRYLPGTTIGSNDIYCLNKDKIEEYDDPNPNNEEVQKAGTSSTESSPGGRTALVTNIEGETTGTKTWGNYSSNDKQMHWKFKYLHQKYYKEKLNKIISYKASELMGKPVFRYYGLPLTNVSISGKIKFDINLTNPATVSIKKDEFSNGAIPTTVGSNGVVYSSSLSAGVHTITFEHIQMSKTESDTYWLKVCPKNAGDLCEVKIIGGITQEFARQ